MRGDDRPGGNGGLPGPLSASLEAPPELPALEPGATIAVHPDQIARGDPLALVLEECDADLLWLRGKGTSLCPGDLVLLERAVPSDARYLVPAEVEVVSPERLALRPAGTWQRLQQRSHVRIGVEGLPLRVVRSEPDPEDGEPGPSRELATSMVDLSAGGVRFYGDRSFQPGELLVCHFELPEAQPFVLPAEVVNRAPDQSARKGRCWVGARFTGLDAQHESALIRWVFYEQVRRHLREREVGG